MKQLRECQRLEQVAELRVMIKVLEQCRTAELKAFLVEAELELQKLLHEALQHGRVASQGGRGV